jgi:beta-lactamase regulating signal transducer with metallopeptidase domain
MNSLFTLIPVRWTEAIGWTLIHSLWQGLLIGLLTWLVLRSLNHFSARIRYRVAFAALLLIPVLAVITFTRVYEPAAATTDQQLVYMNTFLYNAAAPEAPATFNWLSLLPWVVTAWLLGAVFFMLRFAGGFLFVQRLRFAKHGKLPYHVQALLSDRLRELHIRKRVRIAESIMVKSPVLIGYFRPVILLPLGCAAGLPKEQLEALLVHELAHVLRHDFILNLVQEMLRMFFFYHPVTWWLNKVIRDERENCCDDIVFASGIEKLHLAAALAAIEEQQLQGDALVLAAKRGSNLVERIRRMFRNETIPTPRERAGASVLLLAGLLLVTTSVSLAQAYKAGDDKTDSTAAADQDGDGDGDTTKTSKRRSKNMPPPPPPPYPVAPLPPMPPPPPGFNSYARVFGDSIANYKNIRIERDEKGNVKSVLVDDKPYDLNKLDTAELNKIHRQEQVMEKYWQDNEKKWELYQQQMEKYGRELSSHYEKYPMPPMPDPAELEALREIPAITPFPELAELEALRDLAERQADRFESIADMAELQAQMAEAGVRNSRIDSLRELLELEMEKELQKQDGSRREHEAVMREHEAAMRSHEADMRKHEADMRVHDAAMKEMERRNEKLGSAIESELKKDNLLGKNNSYKICVTKTTLEINNKKMDPAMHRKYLAIVEKINGPLSDDDSFIFINNYKH